MTNRRRQLIAAVTAAALLFGASACAQEQPDAGRADADSRSVLTLLGTRGGPGALPDRAGIASLVTVGDRHYLIDAGGGVTEQLAKAEVAVRDVSTVFLTHLHDDHTAGLPALMTYALMTQTGGVEVVGPPGTVDLVERSNRLIDVNAVIRNIESGGRFDAPQDLFKGQDVLPGVIFDDGTVTVTAVENTHFKLAADALEEKTKSYAFRFELPDRTIVFTGDTGPSKAVDRLAAGADILVAEMISAEDLRNVPEFIVDHLLQEHLTAKDVGEMAASAGVGMVVASHVRRPSADDAAEIARYFDGRVIIGEDLQGF